MGREQGDHCQVILRGLGSPNLLLYVAVIPEKYPPHPFHSSDVEIVSVSFSLETKVHPVASPEEKVSEAKGKAFGEKAQPQYLWASREEFPVVHSETRGTCYLRVSAFDVIGALRRFGVEPGTSCTA